MRSPLANPPRSPSLASPSDAASSRLSAELPGLTSEPEFSEKATTSVDLRFLKDPSGYHSLGTEDIPETFLNPQNQPPLDTPLQDLLQHGHFRRAAGAALIELSQCPPDDARPILQLLYTRLACLVLISRADLASVEAATLTDFLARNPPWAADVVPLIPWDLRLLLVRLQSIGAADGGRRGVMALYALAAEVRLRINEAREAGNDAELSLWSVRLNDLGLRVTDTLVEMGELETATRHLDTLSDVNVDELAYRKALLRLRVGDVAGAQHSVDKIHGAVRKAALEALLEVANGHYPEAVEKWRSRVDQDQNDALFGSNLAVGLLYTDKIAEARQVFEGMAESLSAFPGLLFNLGTIYELCTEHALERKADLAGTMANKVPTPASGGWERSNFEFKL